MDVECQMRAAVRSHVMFHLQRQKETFIASSELRGLEPAHLVTIIDYRDQYERKFQDLIATGIQEGFFAHNDVSNPVLCDSDPLHSRRHVVQAGRSPVCGSHCPDL